MSGENLIFASRGIGGSRISDQGVGDLVGGRYLDQELPLFGAKTYLMSA